VTTPATEDLARVTVISPSRRIDVALPGTTSLGECLPTIVRFSGYEPGSTQEAVHAWVLQRLGEDPLDPTKRVSSLNLRDGEILHLRSRDNAIPDAAFDDVVDAVTTATSARPSWTSTQSLWFGVVTMMAVLLAIPAVLLVTTHDVGSLAQILETVATLFLSMAAAVGSIVLSRAFGRFLPAAGLAWASTVLAVLGGYFILPGQDWPLRVLLAAACGIGASATAWLASKVQPYAHLAVTLSATVVLVATMVMVLMGGYEAQVSAVTVALVLAVTPTLPMLSYHSARVAMPNLPANAQLLMEDETPVQTDIVTRALTADRVLGSFLGATGLTVAIGVIPVLLFGDPLGLALTAAVGLALVLRARAFVGRVQRLALLLPGTVLVIASALLLMLAMPIVARVPVGLAIALLGALALAGYTAAMYNRILAPIWGRLADVLEWLALMSVVPLVLGVCGTYGWVIGVAAGH
jgi:type VII secretion integral membrane protein EccD